jgi:drug/metabolite transporter (DMT)-like permease
MTVNIHATTDRRASKATNRLAGILAALGAVFIWGLTFVPTKIAIAEMGPFTLAALRFCLALAVLLPVASRSGLTPAQLRRLPWLTLAALGLTGVTLYFGLQNLGLARTSATEAGLISGCVPAVTAAMSAVVLRERLPVTRIIGIIGSVAGVAVMVLASSPASGGSLEGDLLMLAGALAWAAYTLLNKGSGGKLPESVLLASTMAFGLLFLTPPAAYELATAAFGPVSAEGWLSLLFLGLAGSAAAFFCWNAALRHLDASEASTYINLVPLVTVLSAALMLGERPTTSQVVGGGLVIAGVYFASKG